MDLFNKYLVVDTLENKKIIFKITVIGILIYFIFSFLFPNDYASVIVLIVFIVCVIYIYLIQINTNTNNVNELLMYKLNSLQEITNSYIHKEINSKSQNKLSKKQIQDLYSKNTLNSLYIDANLINFLYSIKILSDWNLNEFYLLLKGTNNILLLRRQIKEYYDANKKYPINTYQMFEDSLFLRSNLFNNIHNFIYKIPKENKMYSYINEIIERFQVLISRNTDILYEYTIEYRKMNGINNTTKFPIYNTIKANDPLEIDFYI